MVRIATVCALWALAACAPAWARQDGDAAPVAVEAVLPGIRALPANTPVAIEITEAISSKTSKRGQRFELRLHAPLLLDGVVVVPAGVPGVGEVIHADSARGGGKAGELLLAARYLEYAGVRIPLRGFRVGASGQDHSKAAMATSFALGPFAQFIHGGEVEIPAATIAQARIATEIALPTASGDGRGDEQPTTPGSAPATSPAADPPAASSRASDAATPQPPEEQS